MLKQKIVLFWSIIIAIIVMVFSLYYFPRYQVSLVPPSESYKVEPIPLQQLETKTVLPDTTEWIIYRNDKNDVAFKYPQEWIVGENDNDKSAEKHQVAYLVKKSYPKDVAVVIYLYITNNPSETLRNKLAMTPKSVVENGLSRNGKELTVLRVGNEQEGRLSIFAISKGKLFEITPMKPDGGYFMEYAITALGVAQTLN